ncbi:MAG: hypothetical protein ACOCY6_01970 [Halodesulfurarchaeum sp.]
MTTKWYCLDCESPIESDAVEDHEAQGHRVKGIHRPDRLMGNDPWNMQVEVDGELHTGRVVHSEEES